MARVVSVLTLIATLTSACSTHPRVIRPRVEQFDRAAAERACRKAPVAQLPPDAPAVLLGPALQVWFQAHPIGSSAVGLGSDAVDVKLPPGCHDVAVAIRKKYGQNVRVSEDIVILPVSGGV